MHPNPVLGDRPNPGSGRELQVWKGVGEEVVVPTFPQGGVRRGHSVGSSAGLSPLFPRRGGAPQGLLGAG